tara:strand:- start:65 stop:514 length:450 start_codon:yes stop_codon:yes gene_type:complete
MSSNAITLLEEKPTLAQILALENDVLKLPQIDLKTTHALSGGVYARTMFVPAGTVYTGATHKKDHVNVFQGDITVWTEGGMKRFTGQHVIESKAGAKRTGYTHSDTSWTTICATDKTDIEEIESDLVEEPEQLQTRKLLSSATPELAEV